MILDTFSRSKSIDLALHNILATVAQSDLDPFASSVLQTGWVQMYNIPDFAKSIEAITLIAELAGEVLVVDEVSLIKEGPVRVKLRARDLSALRDYKEISIADIGYEIKFVAEKSVSKPKDPDVPPPKKPDEDHLTDDDEADDLSDFEGEVLRSLEGGKTLRQRGPVKESHTSGKKNNTTRVHHKISQMRG
jgi:hypothetical protein